ncbi:MAG: Fur family transcriptional regulator [Geothermobacteraceae bacterium]
MATTPDRLEKVILRLRERNCRVTPQRIAILKAFLDSNEHPGIEQVYRQVQTRFPTTSLATVYKTVALLKEMGEILEIGFPDGQKRFDGNKPFPHPHIICEHCGVVLDPDTSQVDNLIAEIADNTGFKVTSHQIQLIGTCPSCQKKPF